MSDTGIVFNLQMFKTNKVVKLVTATGYENLLKHSHDFIETVYVAEGEAQHYLTGISEEKIKKGDFLVIQPGVEHYFLPKYSNDNLKLVNFIFSKELFPFITEYPCMCIKHFSAEESVMKLLETLQLECENDLKDNNEIIKCLMKALLLNVIQKFINVKANKQSGFSENMSKEICEYIKDNSGDDLTLDSLANKFYCSKNTIVTLFRKNYNTTVYHYILKIRIEKSCELLIKTDLSNREICEIVGFKDFRNFYRYFKSVVGETPQNYKKAVNKESEKE